MPYRVSKHRTILRCTAIRFFLSYVIAQHNRSVRRACYIDMQRYFIPTHVNERINSQLIHQFIHHQDGSQSHFPIQTLGVPLAVNAIGDIILRYYDGNIPSFNIKGHAGMHDCYLVADMPPIQTLEAHWVREFTIYSLDYIPFKLSITLNYKQELESE